MINALEKVTEYQEKIILIQNDRIQILEEEVRLLMVHKNIRSISGLPTTDINANGNPEPTKAHKKNILIKKIENVIINMVYDSDVQLKTNFSDYLSETLNHDYTYLANIFSETQGITIEHFIISHKIQRVKALIEYNELNLTEISWKLHYSSVAHLSTQFKKVTGMTPSHYKQLEYISRMAVVNV